ncbi:hypothetical protein DAEQUDRAFT_767586 [Daedalea quercina L-15889]|uniref:Uncharacterized protein n=1 Tax=Daedalea quercina L-15889 TaxID=1314783 RepID=A0A165NFJ7_9APHY|nr:hypothetical protein DAEQUDRAFT_767586 [Daedalea quercina L-15889]
MSSTPLRRVPRERPQPVENRGSMLRASILESALELGVGNGGAVAKWMFSPVEEADEDFDPETAASPSLTYASTATSEDSFLSNSISPRSQPGAGILLSQSKSSLAGPVPPSAYPSREGLSPINEGGQHIQFDLNTSPEPRVVLPTPPTGLGSRFRKLRLNANGDESDGGYISEGGKGKKEKKVKSKKKPKDDGNGAEYESDGGYFSEASRTQRKKDKKDKKAAKEKVAESPATEYETDGAGSKSKKNRARKASIMSSGTGDESDGGNMSEASAKKRGFFRINTRSRKKRDADDSPAQDVPPVPSLPAGMMPLPIADRFLRSPTPNMAELSRTMSDTSRTMSELSRTTTDSSRTPTPLASSATTPDGTSLISYASTDPDAGSIIAREGLTRAFGDAKSIHRPSYDMLATFRNGSPLPPLPNQAQKSSSPTPHSFAHGYNSPAQSPGGNPPKKSAKPVISAPNTTFLSAKHVPAPLVLGSPSSIHSQAALPHTPGSDYVMVTPQASPTPNQAVQLAPSPEADAARPDSEYLLPSPSRRGFSDNSGSPSPQGGQSSLRPQVLAYYNIPPPTPPPQGPLPDVPPESSGSPRELSRTASVDDMRTRSPYARTPLSASRSHPPPTRTLPLTPMSAPMHPARSSSESDVRSASPPRSAPSVPVISEPIPRAQRGRVSPFPTAPVQPARALSPLFSRAESPALMTPMSAGPATSSRAERMARYIGNKPASADDYAPSSGWRDPERLDARWAPRSNSALEQQRPDAFDVHQARKKVSFEDERPSVEEQEDELVYPGRRYRPDMDDERSELHMGDDSDMDGDLEPPVDGEIDVVMDDDRSFYPEDDDRSHYDDSRPGTAYSEGDRSSVWSQSDGRRSFFDEEKSASARERFVKQVEKMYGEYKVPPVPALDPRQLNRGVVG